jgi:retinol dehydrogenase 13
VDILINNAGLTFHPFAKTSDGFEMHLQVNYLGHFLLTHLLTPLLKKSKQGRIINVSAHAYSAGKMCIDDPLGITTLAPQFHPRDAFAHSKLAIVLWTRKLAKLLTSTSITVNCLTPGLVRGTNHMRQSPIMRAFSAKLIMFPCMFMFMKTAVMGAQTAIYLATDEKIKTTTGEYFK